MKSLADPKAKWAISDQDDPPTTRDAIDTLRRPERQVRCRRDMRRLLREAAFPELSVFVRHPGLAIAVIGPEPLGLKQLMGIVRAAELDTDNEVWAPAESEKDRVIVEALDAAQAVLDILLSAEAAMDDIWLATILAAPVGEEEQAAPLPRLDDAGPPGRARRRRRRQAVALCARRPATREGGHVGRLHAPLGRAEAAI